MRGITKSIRQVHLEEWDPKRLKNLNRRSLIPTDYRLN
jgi:hypothetical protein